MRSAIPIAIGMGFCFKQGKEKTKPARTYPFGTGGQKDFVMCVAESKSWFAPVLFIAQPLAVILKQLYKLNEE